MDERLSSGSFDNEIEERISQCKDFLVIISEKSLQKRSDGIDHYIKEIESALKKQKNIIPIFLGDITLPKRSDLPKEIRGLADGKYEYPQKIWRPIDGSGFQKSVITGVVNELMGEKNDNQEITRKLLKSKPLYKIKKRVLSWFCFLLLLMLFGILHIRIEKSYVSVKSERDSISQKYSELKDEMKFWNGNIANSFESGSGVETDPYIIATAQQLAFLATMVNHGEDYTNTYFRLKNDIYLNDTSNSTLTIDINGEKNAYLIENYHAWTPIGNEQYPFKGYFDGNKKTIYGLYIDTTESDADQYYGFLSFPIFKTRTPRKPLSQSIEPM